jgi:hypothetical protein
MFSLAIIYHFLFENQYKNPSFDGLCFRKIAPSSIQRAKITLWLYLATSPAWVQCRGRGKKPLSESFTDGDHKHSAL